MSCRTMPTARLAGTIPLLLAWTLPILALRICKGKGSRDPREALKLVKENPLLERLPRTKLEIFVATLLINIAIRWVVVVLTYYTKPDAALPFNVGKLLPNACPKEPRDQQYLLIMRS